MRLQILMLIRFYCIFVFLLCENVGIYALKCDSLSFSKLKIYPNEVFTIKSDIDLGGETLFIPPGVTLSFDGGMIRNGSLVGQDTKIICERKAFGKVSIKGTWLVPKINSSWFEDLSYENALKDVFALTNPRIQNKVIISEGVYIMDINCNGGAAITIGSNTDLVLNGKIILKSNPWSNYYILYVKGDNIHISGKGIIVGDKHTHTGVNGEWGMGIMIVKSQNVYISGITIQDCWGDCIYIGNNSMNVNIVDCCLGNSRRQGISVTSGNKIMIRNTKIVNISGTNPEYAIDIEPNKNETVTNVLIEGVLVDECGGGFLVWGKAPGAKVGKVEFRNCQILKVRKQPISVQYCDEIIVQRCNWPSSIFNKGIYI